MNTTTGRTAQSKAHSAIDKTAAGAHKTVDQIADAATPVIERVTAGAHQTVDKLASAAAPAAGWIESGVRKLNKSRLSAVQSSKDCLQNYPFATLGAALALGALIAVVATSRAQ